ncbi:hypothetical protein L873DRAFT_1823321 [Choiromyces venosus 120613-1]|uniref:Uncharacterized protein n=1 Tax=Choiromyces venosus 120613-1 TaxID=1336337 RepID=A0A3N4IW81_9PEZI|nr:hypothetical protein L873DRAFT_1823321 [Choiromyces venosus 120613-1]
MLGPINYIGTTQYHSVRTTFFGPFHLQPFPLHLFSSARSTSLIRKDHGCALEHTYNRN